VLPAGRVTVVGNHLWPFSAEQDWCTGFRLRGWQVVEVSERESTAAEVVRAASRSDVLLWVSSSDRHDQAVMRRCRDVTRAVAWHADLFFGLSGRGTAWRESPMWAAEHVFTADGGNDDRWREVGVESHRWMLPGVRDEWTARPGRLRDSFRCDVAFVGSVDSYHVEWPYRRELVEALRVMCARNGWTFRNPGGSDRRVERSGRLNDFYRSARVTVGDSLCFDREGARYWSDRVYEATGRGGVLVMPRIDALAAQFPSMPFYRWGDWNHLESTVGALLDDPMGVSDVVGSCRAVTAAGHTYGCRVDQLLEAIG